MRLLINAIPLLGQESGIGTYTRHIAEGCQEKGVDITYFYGYPSKRLIPGDSGQSGAWLSNIKGIVKKINLGRKFCIKALHAGNKIADLFFPRSWDCYFEPNFILFPTLRAERKIITVHDFSCFRYPQWHPPARVHYMERFFWDSIEQADCIITGSRSILEESTRMFGISEKRIIVIPDGVDHSHYYPRDKNAQELLRKKYGLPFNFVLYVGALEPRKNLANLIRAHSALPTTLKARFPLLLIGSRGWINDEILELIRLNADHTRMLGYVSRADLPIFYSAATLFAYPSWYEGFGLPVLEAMACGRAILTSTDAALKELTGDAALHAQPDSVRDITLKLQELLENISLRKDMESKALLRANDYSWKKSAKRHLEVFHNLV